MLPSVRAFFAGILDYAGLFPPAQLPLDEAVRNYLRYRAEDESWLLEKFVIAEERLPELKDYRDSLFQRGAPITFSVVYSKQEVADNFMRLIKRHAPDDFRLRRRLLQVLDSLETFKAHHGPMVAVASVEMRVPLSLFDQRSSERVKEIFSEEILFAGIDDLLTAQGFPLLSFFFELDPVPDSLQLASFLAALTNDPLRRRGYKLRCGGLHASTVPSVEHVAHVIAACRDAGVPLKFTAGLHHPLRHDDQALQTKLHGFLNVFAAGVLAHARKLNEEQLREIVADEDAGHFTFAEGGFAWKDHCASVEEIATARQHGVISFGSCSFEEPRDDLRKLGLL